MILRNESDLFLLLRNTCGFTKKKNVKGSYLKKYYGEKIALNEATLWSDVKKLGVIEQHKGNFGILRTYTKLGRAYFSVSLLKQVSKALGNMLVFGEYIFLPSVYGHGLVVELSNGWVLLIAGCDIREENDGSDGSK